MLPWSDETTLETSYSEASQPIVGDKSQPTVEAEIQLTVEAES